MKYQKLYAVMGIIRGNCNILFPKEMCNNLIEYISEYSNTRNSEEHSKNTEKAATNCN